VDDRWRLLSLPEHVYPDEPRARAAMLDLARRHVALQSLLSEHRCIVFCESGQGDFRIWQIVRKERTLADAVTTAGEADTADEFAIELLEIARFLARATVDFRQGVPPLSVALCTVSSLAGRPVFSGFVAERQPDFDLREPDTAAPAAVVIEQLRDPIQKAMNARAFAAPAVLRQIERLKRDRDAEDLAAALSVLVIGH
jgi:hypothetical protein